MFDPRRIDAMAKSMADIADEPEDKPSVPKEYLTDVLVPSVGNRYAWENRDRSETEGEVYVVIDLADVSAINWAYGRDHGDRLLQAAGDLLSKAAKAHEGEGYRLKGDYFVFTLPTPEDAYEFLRQAVEEYKAFPPIGAYGFASFAAGLGDSVQAADLALVQAKLEKVRNHGDWKKGKADVDTGHGRCYVYSNIGTPGLVPLDVDPEIPAGYVSPIETPEETAAPMALRPAVEAEEGAEAEAEEEPPEEERVEKGERPDFLRLVRVDVP